MRVRWVALLMLLVTLCPLVAAANSSMSDAAATAGGATPPATTAERFALGLEHEVESRFRLFGTRAGGADAALASGPASSEPAPEVVLTASLVYSPGEHPVPDDLRINLKPRTWGDLDGWEKAGVVLGYAGSVAGAAYIASRIID